MNTTNLTAPLTSNPTEPSRYLTISHIAPALALSACAAGLTVAWHPVTDGTELIVSVDGFDKVLISVVPAGADQIFDHTEVDFGYLETTTTDGVDLAKLDLTMAGLCP